MSTPYDISTVVSRSYISESIQDNMQKGAEHMGAFTKTEFQKKEEVKQKTVQKSDKTENPNIRDNPVKAVNDREEKKKRRYSASGKETSSNSGRKETPSNLRTSKIDFTI